MGPGTNVILQFDESNWLPCIDMLRAAGVDVYVTVNGRKVGSQFDNEICQTSIVSVYVTESCIFRVS